MGIPNNNPFNKIKCNDSSSTKSAIFTNNGVSIIQGANTLLNMALADFLPVNDYQYKEFTLGANVSPSNNSSVSLESCNTTNENGENSALIVVVEYPKFDVSNEPIATDKKYINFTYGGQTCNIGKVMILTGTNEPGMGWDLLSSPGGIVLINPHENFSVRVKVLIFA